MKKINRKKGNTLVIVVFVVSFLILVNYIFSEDPVEEENLTNTYDSSSFVPLESPVINNPTIHVDDSYDYNYRTGYSGNYEYSYDIDGYGDNGYVYGDVETSGKYGEGYVYDEDGNEIWVETEWTGYGVLEAYDEDGNYYELETN